MEIDWTNVVTATVMSVAKVVVPVFVALVLKWAVELWLRIKEDYPSLGSVLSYVAQIGYDSAEEYFRNVPDATSENKMEYAVATALDYLKSVYGKTTDEVTMATAINHYGVDYEKFSWVKEKEGEGNE